MQSTTQAVPVQVAWVWNLNSIILKPHRRTHWGWLFPDGDGHGTRSWARVPVVAGLNVAATTDDLDTELWISCGRDGGVASYDLDRNTIKVDRFPFDEPRTLSNAFSIIISSQHAVGSDVQPINRIINRLIPDLPVPWRGNVLVVKHGATKSKPFINVTREDSALVEAIIKRVLRDGLLPRFMSLKELATYSCLSMDTMRDVQALLSARIRRYVSPFIPDASYETFFSRLDDFRSLIVGSVALAAICVTSDPPNPTNLNLICPFQYQASWKLFLIDEMGFILNSDAMCSRPYARAGSAYISFHREDCPGLTITLTVASNSDIFELLYAAPCSHQTNAIGPGYLLCSYLELTMRFESLKGFAYGLWEEIPSDVSPTYLPSASPFPQLVSLLDSTRDWDRECGAACPGLWRFVGRDRHIIRIAWNEDRTLTRVPFAARLETARQIPWRYRTGRAAVSKDYMFLRL
ncbi:hypothetical protein C8J57DRAFT_1643763 [Mycena rebaudengoi]|nr:hypothetical protein C8J57DRAFT_1643763 [Mycena rebaudengoi]